MRHPLTWRVHTGATLRYRYGQLHSTWLRVTGRCPGCLQRHGAHKMDCSRQ